MFPNPGAEPIDPTTNQRIGSVQNWSGDLIHMCHFYLQGVVVPIRKVCFISPVIHSVSVLQSTCTFRSFWLVYLLLPCPCACCWTLWRKTKVFGVAVTVWPCIREVPGWNFSPISGCLEVFVIFLMPCRQVLWEYSAYAASDSIQFHSSSFTSLPTVDALCRISRKCTDKL